MDRPCGSRPFGRPHGGQLDVAGFGGAVGLLAAAPFDLGRAHRHARAVQPKVHRGRGRQCGLLGDGAVVSSDIVAERLGTALDLPGLDLHLGQGRQQLARLREGWSCVVRTKATSRWTWSVLIPRSIYCTPGLIRDRHSARSLHSHLFEGRRDGNLVHGSPPEGNLRRAPKGGRRAGCHTLWKSASRFAGPRLFLVAPARAGRIHESRIQQATRRHGDADRIFPSVWQAEYSRDRPETATGRVRGRRQSRFQRGATETASVPGYRRYLRPPHGARPEELDPTENPSSSSYMGGRHRRRDVSRPARRTRARDPGEAVTTRLADSRRERP